MAREKDLKVVKDSKDSKEYKMKYTLKDFDGEIVFEMLTAGVLVFSYLFWNQRLFVSSRDEAGVFLERSYHVYMGVAHPNEKT